MVVSVILQACKNTISLFPPMSPLITATFINTTAQRIAFYPQSLEAIKLQRHRGRSEGGIKRVGLNRGAAPTLRLCGL
jgi:hypothetical protein